MYPLLIDLNCLEWYLYDFDKNASKETINYIGENDGNYKKS